MANDNFLELHMNTVDQFVRIKDPKSDLPYDQKPDIEMTLDQARFLRDYLNEHLPYFRDEHMRHWEAEARKEKGQS